MDGLGNNNFAKSSPFVQPETLNAPPPPSEVKVRTMRGDLDSMTKSGGGLPHFQNVKVDALAANRAEEAAAPVGRKNNNLFILLIALAAAVILGIVVYFVYITFFAGNASTSGNTQTQTSAVQPQSSPSSTIPAAMASTTSSSSPATVTTSTFTHVSLFVVPANQVLTLALPNTANATSATALQSFSQVLTALLNSQAKKTSTMIEIDAKDPAGNAASVNEIFTAANFQVLNSTFFTQYFNPDPTFFVYHDKTGYWPGVVIALQPNENWLFLQNDVAQLESSTMIGNLFLTNPGTPSADGFTDSAVSSTPVRVLPFTTSNSAAYFTYGWFNGYLILSTSENGFAQAISELPS